MKLIADSGSTKTDWRLIQNDGSIDQFKTPGLNPYFVSTVDVAQTLSDRTIDDSDLEVWFYGAGCSSPQQCNVIKDGLTTAFPNAQIHVDHDLMGAARALCGKERGIAAILGTGSNSCVFDGSKITEQIPSLGYILGDEGSGAYIGKRLLADYHNGQLPKAIADRLADKFDVSIGTVLQRVYKEENPNRYLASFARYVCQLKPEQYAVDLLSDAFRKFIELRVTCYENYREHPLHVTGSVGFYNVEILRTVCGEYNIDLGNVVEAPIARMVLYHQGEL